MRDTSYARELSRASIQFQDGSEGRIERLYFKKEKDEGVRFSWWKGNRMVLRPLDAIEDQFLLLMKNALREGVFSKKFITSLRSHLNDLP